MTRTTTWMIEHDYVDYYYANVATEDIDKYTYKLFQLWLIEQEDNYMDDDSDEETAEYRDTDEGWDNFQCELHINPNIHNCKPNTRKKTPN